ncbi:hypothetical protein HDU86_007088 [Geranomyces michiganensis]|nr:hypothetical protein HDU86_007088 [Geranomyces michiganensis]
MRVVKLKIGVYFQAQQGHSFCIYYFPHRPSAAPPQASSSGSPALAATAETSFFRVRDLDAIFFNEDPGHIQRSGKISASYLASSAHAFHENTGDLYLSAAAVADTAKRLGNYLLAEFVTLAKEQIYAGAGNEMLRSVPSFQWKQPFTETEEELDSAPGAGSDASTAAAGAGSGSGAGAGTAPPGSVLRKESTAGHSPAKQQQQRQSPSRTGEEQGRYEDSQSRSKNRQSAATKGRRSKQTPRGSSEHDMDTDREHSNPQGGYKQHGGVAEHGVKRHRSEAEFSEPAHSAHSDAGSEDSHSASEDAHNGRPRSRKRLSINTSVAGGNIATRQPSGPNPNAPPSSASMDMIGNTLRLKQQQQAIIEARQFQQRGPMSANPDGGPPSAYDQAHHRPSRRNSKNLTIRTGEPGVSGSRGAMTAPADHGPHGMLHPGRAHSSMSALPSPRHLNPAPGKSSKLTPRGPEASRYNPAIHSAVPAAQSPRGGEFPSRELPLPPHLHPHHPHPSSHFQSQQQQQQEGPPRSPLPPMNFSQDGRGGPGPNSNGNNPPSKSNSLINFALPPPSPASAYPPPLHPSSSASGSSAFLTHQQQQQQPQPPPPPPHALSKQAVLSFFESMYDQGEETSRLQYTLRDQIRRSTAMLQTLQSSGQMIEGLVRGHFREMQVTYGEKFGAALHDLSRRVERLERAGRLGETGGGGDSGAQNGADGSGGPPMTSTTSPGGTTTTTTHQERPSMWGFKGGPPSANPNGAQGGAASFFLGDEAGGGRGVEAIVRGIMDRLDRLEKRPATRTAPAGTGKEASGGSHDDESEDD